MSKRATLEGIRFGRLLVVGYSRSIEKSNRKHPFWMCRCECGREKEVSGDNLSSGHTKSCGCLSPDRSREIFTKHGLTESAEYKVWTGILTRCDNPNVKGFSRYGGRGIGICSRWRKFENFLADMGPRPSKGHSVDRWPNNDGNYDPNNCRWATMEEQANNKVTNVRLIFNGTAMSIRSWARVVGLSGACLWYRIQKSNWTVRRALTTPARRTGRIPA